MTALRSISGGHHGRRWLLYALVAIAAGGIVLLRGQARRVNSARASRTVGGSVLGERLEVALDGGTRYVIEASGDPTRLRSFAGATIQVIDARSRATVLIAPVVVSGSTQDMGDGRVRQQWGRLAPTQDGVYRVLLDPPPTAGIRATDSLIVARAATGRDVSQSFGMLALGGVFLLVTLALGGIIGRSFLDRDAT